MAGPSALRIEMTPMRLDLRQFPGSSALLRDYRHDFSRLAPYFAWNPHDPAAYAGQALRCDGRRYAWEDLGAILRDQNAGWGAPPIVHQRIAALCGGRGLAILTGQQTGLFGGPLFTLYKALTTLTLAESLARDLGRPVVPLFWMASEDHDVAEADHVHLTDRTGSLGVVRHHAWASPPGFMPANLVLGPAIHETIAQVWEFLPPTEFSATVKASLLEAYAPDRTLADAFARWMVHLLGETGLVLVDASDPRLKRLAADVVRRELETAPATSCAILEVSQSLRAGGYPTQIEARPDGVNCFLLRDGRRPLVRDEAELRLRDSGEPLTPTDLDRLAEREPERFSPNVALRPIVQDTLFPTLAYIAGPGELAYFAQLRPVYEAFGVPMPVIVPRATLTLLEPRAAQLLERFHLGLSDLTPDPEQLASRVLRTQLPPDLETTLTEARSGVDEIFRRVAEAVAGVDGTLKATAGQTAGHIQGHLDQLERKAVQALKRRETETRQQVLRLREALMPGGRPQERVFPVLPYLVKYGPKLLQTIREHVDGPGWEHLLLPLGTDSDQARHPTATSDGEGTG